MSSFSNEILANMAEDQVVEALDRVMNHLTSPVVRRLKGAGGRPTEGDAVKIKLLIDLISKGAEAWHKAKLEALKTEAG
jgi:hypothetical protein